jgi:alpha-ketoglutarate-dependent taurine dioxygenase
MTAEHLDLGNDPAYLAWRERRLAEAPRSAAGLLVEVTDLAAPTPAERDALLERVRRANMAVYATTPGTVDKSVLRGFAAGFGLVNLDANTLSDEDGITPLAVAAEGPRSRYIPYTARAISWHSDGYYNALDHQVRGMVLHCACPAAEGGENDLLDHELAYIALRDAGRENIAALMDPEAMMIPGNSEDGNNRGDSYGPVFMVIDGALHMRYTARARNVVWKDDPAVRQAARLLEDLLAGGSPFIIRHRLAAGQGLLCNNVLHTRRAFRDDPAAPRLLYRARFHDRISGT